MANRAVQVVALTSIDVVTKAPTLRGLSLVATSADFISKVPRAVQTIKLSQPAVVIRFIHTNKAQNLSSTDNVLGVKQTWPKRM